MTDRDIINQLADLVDPAWRAYVLDPKKENMPDVIGASKIAAAIQYVRSDITKFNLVGETERSITKIIARDDLLGLKDVAVSRKETGKTVGPGWDGGTGDTVVTDNGTWFFPEDMPEEQRQRLIAAGDTQYRSSRVPGGGPPARTPEYQSGRVPGTGSAQGSMAPAATPTSPSAPYREPTPYQEPTSAMGSDVVLTRILPLLNAGAREYVNTVRRVGKWGRITLPAGVSGAASDYLDRVLAGEMVDFQLVLDNKLLANDSGPNRQALQTAIIEAKGQASTLENQRFPYYNPRTSQVEMLTRDEARGIVPVGTNVQSASVSVAQIAPYVSGAGDIEPGELSRMSPDEIVANASATETGYVLISGDITGIPGLGDFASTVILPGRDVTTSTDTETTVDTKNDEAGDGGGFASDVAAEPVETAIPQDWQDAAREAYPQYYAIIKNIPEIAKLLEDAVANGWPPQQFQAKLEQTNWWQQTTASAREWDINGERDPATQQTSIDNRVAFVRQLALDTFGVRLGPESLEQLSVDSLRFGWSQQFLVNAIGDVATQSTAGVSQLRAGYIGQGLRETANNYGIAVSDATFNRWVNSIAVGQETNDSFTQYAITQAKNLFPSISERLDAGETFQDIVDPYRENAAKLLEIDPGGIDFTMPEWAKAVTYTTDKGEQRPMTFTEWNDYVRQTKSFGYEYTEQARNRAYQVANELGRLFGRA